MKISEIQPGYLAIETQFGSHSVKPAMPTLATQFGSHSIDPSKKKSPELTTETWSDYEDWQLSNDTGQMYGDEDGDEDDEDFEEYKQNKYHQSITRHQYFRDMPDRVANNISINELDLPYGRDLEHTGYHKLVHKKIAHPDHYHNDPTRYELHRDHLEDYVEQSYPVNDALHSHSQTKKINPKFKDQVKHIEEFIAGKKLPKEITVYTGVKQSPQEIWQKLNLDHTQPVRVQLPAFTSTSTAFSVTIMFTALMDPPLDIAKHRPSNLKELPEKIRNALPTTKKRHVLAIDLPRGTHAVSMSEFSKEDSLEHEILVQRGSIIEISPTPKMGPYGSVIWHARLIDQRPSAI